MKLDGASTLLTGASGNLGREIARVLVDRGALVKANGRNVEALEALRQELGERVEVLPADLETPDGVRDLAERAGDVDVMVAVRGHIADRSDRAPPTGRARQRPRREPARPDPPGAPPVAWNEGSEGAATWFISSVSGKSFTPSRSLYSSTSYGLRGFAGCLRLDLRGSGVGVTTILPEPMSKPGDTGEAGVQRGHTSGEGGSSSRPRQRAKRGGEMVVAPRALKAIMAVTNTFPVLNRFAPTEPENAPSGRQPGPRTRLRPRCRGV